MNAIGPIALSGLRTAQRGLDVSAQNVANALTPGYRRLELVPAAQPEGGVTATVRQLLGEGADLAADLVAQQAAVYSFRANLKVLQTSDRLLGSLLDALA
jgi:flagellar hook-associated protein FlgK